MTILGLGPLTTPTPSGLRRRSSDQTPFEFPQTTLQDGVDTEGEPRIAPGCVTGAS
jgi:hypothetical protein